LSELTLQLYTNILKWNCQQLFEYFSFFIDAGKNEKTAPDILPMPL
jgi:hypothetical protein